MGRSSEQVFSELLGSYTAFDEHWGLNSECELSPDDFSLVLAFLGGTADSQLGLARRLRTSPEQLRAAAFWYIQKTMYEQAQDHYALLGLGHLASAAQIRHRYRLLIGVLHPDRNTPSGVWEETFVRRLNQAYAVLKNPEKRRNYDAGLKSGARSAEARSAKKNTGAAPVVKPVPPVRPGEALYRMRLVQRHPKAAVWFFIVLALTVFILVSWFSSAQRNLKMVSATGAMVADNMQPESVQPESVQPEPVQSDNVLKNQAESLSVEPVSVVHAGEIDLETTETAVSPASSIQPEEVEQAQESSVLEALPKVPPDSPEPATPAEENDVPEPVPARPEYKAANMSRQAAVAAPRQPVRHASEVASAAMQKAKQTSGATTAQTVKPPVPAVAVVSVTGEKTETPAATGSVGFDGALLPVNGQMEKWKAIAPETASVRLDGAALKALKFPPEYLFMKYVSAYQAGNSRKLLSLFTLRPQTPHGMGRKPLEDAYRQLFMHTSSRKMNIDQLGVRPSTDGRHYLAKARVSVIQRSALPDLSGRYQGEMILQLVEKGGQLYIEKMLHNVRKQN